MRLRGDKLARFVSRRLLMDSEMPANSREELESQLTAFILGELPAEQAFELGRSIEQDVELARLYQRLKVTVELVRETTSHPAEQPTAHPAPLKLSAERREKLLARFKTITPMQLSEPHPSRRAWLVPLAAAAILLLLASISIPNLIRVRTTAQSSAVINNLRQLDGAKQHWALENNKSATDVPI